MDVNLDFKTVRALSSPTRIEILSHSLKNEATTTNTASKLDKSKSTVSSHLEKLVEAELLKKDVEDGRKRVVYRPTEKAEAIVEGRTKKVRFSVASSAITGFTGLVLVSMVEGLNEIIIPGSSEINNSPGPGIMMEDAETAEPGVEAVLADPFFFASAGFFAISLAALGYGLVLRKLN